MNRFTKIPLIALLALFAIVPVASARPHVFIGGGYGGWYGPGFYGPAFYGSYSPWWYGPGYWGPEGYYGYYGSQSSTGSVKIDTKAKDAMVYVDGGYAGKVGDLRTFRLKTGEHDIELRDPSGHTYYQEHVNVLPGKTLDLKPGSNNPPNGPSAVNPEPGPNG